MRRFRSFLDAAQLEELHLHGRRFTWSNERDVPTLERLDRLFAMVDWLQAYPNHVLKALSSDCSDHCPCW
jgi:predicted DNA-binding protein (MmcQ/YjbR family)